MSSNVAEVAEIPAVRFKIVDNCLVVTLPLHDPEPSKSGKTEIVAGTGGPLRTGAKIDGKEITVTASAWIK